MIPGTEAVNPINQGMTAEYGASPARSFLTSSFADLNAKLPKMHMSIPEVQTAEIKRIAEDDDPASVMPMKSDRISAAAVIISVFKIFMINSFSGG